MSRFIQTDPLAVSQDIIGRDMVSIPRSIFESYFEYDAEPRLWDTFTNGTGTFTYNTTSRSCSLSTGGTASGARVVRENLTYIRFRRGKVARINLVTNFNSSGTFSGAAKSRVGYYDDGDGVFIQYSVSGFAVVNRASGSGSTVDMAVSQSSWNLDKLDGTGPSRYTLDPTKGQSVVFEFNSFRTGRIRVGFRLDSRVVYCHEFNSLNGTSINFKRRSLPLRYEVLNDGATGANVTMNQGGSFANELGDSSEEAAYLSVADNGVTTRSVGNASYLPIISVRLKDTFNGQTAHGTILPFTVQLLNQSANNIHLQLVDGVATSISLTGASFVSVGANSQVEYDVSATAFTGGDVISSGYSDASRANNGIPINFPYKPFLGRRYSTGERTIFTIAGKSLSGSQNVAASLLIKEFW